jgi:hypothetical protein
MDSVAWIDIEATPAFCDTTWHCFYSPDGTVLRATRSTVLQLHRDRNGFFVVGALDFFSWPGEMTVFADCANAVGHYEPLSQSSKQLDKRKLFG